MAEWAAFIGPGIGAVGTLAALYARAAMAAHDKAIAVMQSELAAARQEIKDNYRYCHDANHDTRDVVADFDSRIKLTEFKLGLIKF